MSDLNDPDGSKERYRLALEKKGSRNATEKFIRKHTYKQKRLLSLGLTEWNKVAGRKSIIMPR